MEFYFSITSDIVFRCALNTTKSRARLKCNVRKNSIQSAHWPEKSHSKNDNVIETRELLYK